MVAKEFFIGIVVLLALFFITGCDNHEDIEEQLNVPEHNADLEQVDVQSSGKTVHVDIVAGEWYYDPEIIIVQEGDHVILSVSSLNVTQGFSVRSLGIDEVLVPGKTQVFEFDADKKGTYEISCGNYCQKESLAMQGKIIVK